MNEPLDIIFTDGDISGPSAPFMNEKNEPTGIEADKRTIQVRRARETDRCSTVLRQIDRVREPQRTAQVYSCAESHSPQVHSLTL